MRLPSSHLSGVLLTIVLRLIRANYEPWSALAVRDVLSYELAQPWSSLNSLVAKLNTRKADTQNGSLLDYEMLMDMVFPVLLGGSANVDTIGIVVTEEYELGRGFQTVKRPFQVYGQEVPWTRLALHNGTDCSSHGVDSPWCLWFHLIDETTGSLSSSLEEPSFFAPLAWTMVSGFAIDERATDKVHGLMNTPSGSWENVYSDGNNAVFKQAAVPFWMPAYEPAIGYVYATYETESLLELVQSLIIADATVVYVMEDETLIAVSVDGVMLPSSALYQASACGNTLIEQSWEFLFSRQIPSHNTEVFIVENVEPPTEAPTGAPTGSIEYHDGACVDTSDADMMASSGVTCGDYAASGSCDAYFCPTCAYANVCDAACDYCPTTDGATDDGACVDTSDADMMASSGATCGEYAALGSCDAYFCPTCAYANVCDVACDYCPTTDDATDDGACVDTSDADMMASSGVTCGEYAAGGSSCGTYFCPTCAYANVCDAACGYCLSTDDNVEMDTLTPAPTTTPPWGWWVQNVPLVDNYGLGWRVVAVQEISCSAGMEANLNSTTGECSLCPAGKYSTDDELTCTACSPGSVAALQGLATCEFCGAGEYAQESVTCAKCPVGKASTEDELTCTTCPPGSVAAAQGMVTCTFCEMGKYAEGGVTCAKCQSPETSRDGAVTCDLCVFDFYFDTGSGACAKCHPKGVTCPEMSRELIVDPGYWRTDLMSVDILQCPIKSSCIGGNETELCATGYEGVKCTVCSDGYWFSTADQACRHCTDRDNALVTSLLIVILVVIITLLVLPIWFVVRNKTATSVRAIRIKKMVSSFDIARGKILWSTFQLISSVEWSLELRFPEPFGKLVSLFSFFTEFSLASVLPIRCMIPYRFYEHVFMVTLFPLALIIVLFASAAYLKQYTKVDELLSHRLMHTALLIAFVILPSATSSLLRSFHCETFYYSDGTVARVLIADYAQDCDSAEHQQFEWYALAMLVFAFPGGVLVCIGMVLYEKRSLINPRLDSVYDAVDQRAADESLAPLRSLFQPYQPRLWYMELVDLSRRIILMGALVSVPSLPMRAVLGLLFAVLFAVVYREIQPYVSSSINVLSSIALWSIVVVYAGGVLIVTRPIGYSQWSLGLVLLLTSLVLLSFAVTQNLRHGTSRLEIELLVLEHQARDVEFLLSHTEMATEIERYVKTMASDDGSQKHKLGVRKMNEAHQVWKTAPVQGNHQSGRSATVTPAHDDAVGNRGFKYQIEQISTIGSRSLGFDHGAYPCWVVSVDALKRFARLPHHEQLLAEGGLLELTSQSRIPYETLRVRWFSVVTS